MGSKVLYTVHLPIASTKMAIAINAGVNCHHRIVKRQHVAGPAGRARIQRRHIAIGHNLNIEATANNRTNLHCMRTWLNTHYLCAE